MARQQQKSDKPNTLMAATIELLKGKNLHSISLDTSIPFSWLTKFRAGNYPNPSVNRVQTLYEYLTGTKLI